MLMMYLSSELWSLERLRMVLRCIIQTCTARLLLKLLLLLEILWRRLWLWLLLLLLKRSSRLLAVMGMGKGGRIGVGGGVSTDCRVGRVCATNFAAPGQRRCRSGGDHGRLGIWARKDDSGTERRTRRLDKGRTDNMGLLLAGTDSAVLRSIRESRIVYIPDSLDRVIGLAFAEA